MSDETMTDDKARSRSAQAVSSARLTSKDIARLAGVSQATVSRVVRGEESVSSATRDRVLAVIREHDYHPSAAARSMKTRRTNTVAVVVERLSNPLYPYLLQHISGLLRRHGMLMTVWESRPDSEELLLRAIGEGAVDGVLIATATEKEVPLLERVAEYAPVILLNRTISDARFDQFSSNNLAGGASVGRYFLDNMRVNQAILTGPNTASTIRDRERGYIDVLLESGVSIPSTSRLTLDAFSYEAGYQAAQNLLSISPCVDSIFCTNDIIAIGACDGIRAMGRHIPREIWVVGYDDIPMASWECIALSTVRQPLQAMADMAIKQLLSRIDQSAKRDVTDIRLHNNLVIRSTSG